MGRPREDRKLTCSQSRPADLHGRFIQAEIIHNERQFRVRSSFERVERSIEMRILVSAGLDFELELFNFARLALIEDKGYIYHLTGTVVFA